MSRIFWHLGSCNPDYRTIMKRHTDFELGNRIIPSSQTVIAEQTHSNLVHICSEGDSGAGFANHPQIAIADGLITNIPNQYLLIRTADCTPILLFDEEQKVVAALHSGREGTRQNIAGSCIDLMITHYHCNPDRIIAYIGAGICETHYEVSEDIYTEFNNTILEQGFASCTNQHRHLNIRTTIFQQLIRAGLKFINIENVQICTYEDPGYFSFRRDGTKNRQINLIGIIDE